MFPESHAYAFGVTAYQMAWLKHYYPLEFYVGLFNEQPMGFYSLETLKEDAKHHDVRVLNPDVNRSLQRSIIHDESLVLGLVNVESVGPTVAAAIVAERDAHGPYSSIANLMTRTGLQRQALDNLTDAGALDSLASASAPTVASTSAVSSAHTAERLPSIVRGRSSPRQRRQARWEVGLRYRPIGSQLAMELPVEEDMAELPQATDWEVMEGEYRIMGIHPRSHLMAYLRDQLPHVTTSADIWNKSDGTEVQIAGLVVRRQHPHAKVYFLTLEDEFGHTPTLAWPDTYKRYRQVIREPALLITGTVSRREGTMNVVARHVEPLPNIGRASPRSKDWA